MGFLIVLVVFGFLTIMGVMSMVPAIFAAMDFSTWLIVGGFILLAMHMRKKGSSSTKWKVSPKRQIKEDANRFKCKLPSDKETIVMLDKLYNKYNSSVSRYPQLRSHYDSIINTMWESLVVMDNAIDWKATIQSVIRGWPVETRNSTSDLQRKLQEAQEATKQWQESQREAFNGN